MRPTTKQMSAEALEDYLQWTLEPRVTKIARRLGMMRDPAVSSLSRQNAALDAESETHLKPLVSYSILPGTAP